MSFINDLKKAFLPDLKRLKADFPDELVPVYSEVITNIKTGRVDGKRIFSGGDKDDWPAMEVLAKDWCKSLLDNNVFNKDMKIVRLGPSFKETLPGNPIYTPEQIEEVATTYGKWDSGDELLHGTVLSGQTHAYGMEDYYNGESIPGLTDDQGWLYQKYIDSLAERSMSHRLLTSELVKKEIDVIKKGGMIMGIQRVPDKDEYKIPVYFPFTKELVMKQLLSRDQLGAPGSGGQGGQGIPMSIQFSHNPIHNISLKNVTS